MALALLLGRGGDGGRARPEARTAASAKAGRLSPMICGQLAHKVIEAEIAAANQNVTTDRTLDTIAKGVCGACPSPSSPAGTSTPTRTPELGVPTFYWWHKRWMRLQIKPAGTPGYITDPQIDGYIDYLRQQCPGENISRCDCKHTGAGSGHRGGHGKDPRIPGCGRLVWTCHNGVISYQFFQDPDPKPDNPHTECGSSSPHSRRAPPCRPVVPVVPEVPVIPWELPIAA